MLGDKTNSHFRALINPKKPIFFPQTAILFKRILGEEIEKTFNCQGGCLSKRDRISD